MYLHDVGNLTELFGGKEGTIIKNFKKTDDSTVTLSILHPTSPRRGISLNLIIDDVSSYPSSHKTLAYTDDEVSSSVTPVIESLSDLAPASLYEIIGYLIGSLCPEKKDVASQMGLPFGPTRESQAAAKAAEVTSNKGKGKAVEEDESDTENDYEDDELFGINAGQTVQIDTRMKEDLHKDFAQIFQAGFKPGFTRVSELDNVVSVAVPIFALRIPLNALQAWDTRLISQNHLYLVLLINTGSLYPVDLDKYSNANVRFAVGISRKYKPSRDAIATAFRSHSAIDSYTQGEFEAFSLSKTFNSLFERFPEVLHHRRKLSLGWPAAETIAFDPTSDKNRIDQKVAAKLDKEEASFKENYKLPEDPLAFKATSNNYPLIAFSYLVRRFVMCPRYCLVCHRAINSDIIAMKPYICDNNLCLFQFMALGLGPSVEYEIKTNPSVVDLLIQLCFSAAREGELHELPTGLDLKVPLPGTASKQGDKLVDFDGLSTIELKRSALASLIMELPAVHDMKAWLTGEGMTLDEKRLGKSRKLQDMKYGKINPSAFNLLRWIVASNTSYLLPIVDEDEMVQGVPKTYKQFKFIVGSPAKEHLLKKNVEAVKARNVAAYKHPTLFGFHGSSLKNWHSILREGLHFRKTTNGRAFGNGVYFALDGNISANSYSQYATSTWKNADNPLARVFALCEIVNCPNEFVSKSPYFVVDKVDWIQTRYLLVQPISTHSSYDPNQSSTPVSVRGGQGAMDLLPLDPTYPLHMSNTSIQIPNPIPKLQRLTAKLSAGNEEALTAYDCELIFATFRQQAAPQGLVSSTAKKKSQPVVEKDDFVPASEQLLSLIQLLPPPRNASPISTSTLQKEIKAMMKAQANSTPSKLGFYFDPERSRDNLFQWVIELTGFDKDLPLSKDMRDKGVQSLLMEVRFADNFPFSPPFFRIIHPRFLPFIHGGGGHVTGGGSLCMDLLTTDGWSSIYQIEAILLQIRMAISNLEPRPARLDPQRWNQPYTMWEAVQGYERACAAHGWQVPPEIKAMSRM
ncbi:hypothetical protein BT69DRAFT_1276502 [Atractiella rhizophila]|nr:hypothetical protein BT69DRAFT_1276502 [Atractiella rhizophila]